MFQGLMSTAATRGAGAIHQVGDGALAIARVIMSAMQVRIGAMVAAAWLVTAAAACDPPPAWQPGDAPLRVWTSQPEAWDAVEAACSRWGFTGLTCVPAKDRDDADVEVEVVDRSQQKSSGTGGETDYSIGLTRWHYETRLTRDLFTKPHVNGQELVRAVMTHEFGHLLGMWEHLPDGEQAIMTPSCGPYVITQLDMDYLASVWGVEPWKSPLAASP
jgi:hypothetical protein